MKASLLTDIGLGATGAPYPAVPQPVRASKASASPPTARARGARHGLRRARSWPEITFASLLPTVDIRTCPGRKRRVMRRVEWSRGSTSRNKGNQRGQMPNALRIGLLGPLQVRDETGRPVHVGGRQLRVLLALLALNAGRVVPAGSLAAEIWPDDLPGNPGNALQTLVSRLRAELRQAGIGDVIESHPAGYLLAVPPEAVDVMAFEALAARGRRALADGDAGEAARVLRDALLAWRGQPLADAAGCDFADAAAAKLTELRASALADRIEADLALGEGASLVGELRVLLAADPLAEHPRALLMR